MAQSAHNDIFDLPADVWTLISEINCTFVTLGTQVEIIGATALPDPSVRGVIYGPRKGEDAATDVLGRFPGSGGATGIYAMSRGYAGRIFLSRAGV